MRPIATCSTLLAALGLALAAGFQAAQARPIPGQASLLVKTTGTLTANPDGTHTSTIILSPAVQPLRYLDRLGWKDKDKSTEIHLWVFTADPSKVLGRTIDDGQPCDLCETAKSEMAAALAIDPEITRVEHGSTGGLDAEGDAYLLRLNDDVWVRVRAPAGSILYYMDAYHPWLHGEVDVTG